MSATFLTALLLLSSSARSVLGAAKLVDANRTASAVCGELDSWGIVRRKPRCSGWARRAGNEVWMAYNGLGLRDGDFSARPKRDVIRLMVIGGSVAGGSGLPERDSPPRVLEGILRGKGLRVEVVNAAGEGFTGWQNAAVLKEYLDAYSPRIVLYHLAAHYVFTDKALWNDLAIRHDRIVGRRGPLRWAPAWLRPYFFNRRYVIFAIRTYIEQWGRIQTSWQLSRIADSRQKLETLLDPTLRELDQMQQFCATAGASLFVVYDGEEVNADQYPLPSSLYWIPRFIQWLWIRPFRFGGDAVESALREEGRKSGFGVLSLAGDLASLTDPANLLPGDYHWNSNGARIFGEAVARRLLESRGIRRPKTRP